jgi:hypothetical protein
VIHRECKSTKRVINSTHPSSVQSESVNRICDHSIDVANVVDALSCCGATAGPSVPSSLVAREHRGRAANTVEKHHHIPAMHIERARESEWCKKADGELLFFLSFFSSH